MAEIIPAIIGQNFVEIENKIHQIESSVDWAHLDIMDGTFTDKNSWQSPEDLKFLDGKIKIEVHLMIRRPEKMIKFWAEAVDRVIVHVEATDRLDEIMDFLIGHEVESGLAFNLATSLSAFESRINQTDVVQLMAIAEIGEQGHPFDDRVLEKIKILRVNYPNAKIQIDGGVTLDNICSLIAAGADNLVVGSAIWQSPDPLATLKEFQNALARR